MEIQQIDTKLQQNLQAVQARIETAVKRGQRKLEEVHLLAVTKYVGPEIIERLAKLGVNEIGENRVQSLQEKKPQLPQSLHWHLIGSLQKNKARKALQLCEYIHSVDSEDLLQTLNRIAAELKISAKLFLEINLSGESSKHGIRAEECKPLLEKAKELPHVQMIGLMTMAALNENPEASRAVFRKLRELRDQAAAAKLFAGPGELSMGMSQDFEIAIEEGANWVRVGTALYRGIVEGH